MTVKEEPVFDKKNRFYLRNGKTDVTTMAAPEKQAMVGKYTSTTPVLLADHGLNFLTQMFPEMNNFQFGR